MGWKSSTGEPISIPRLDPIVRVEASRLRARLLKYYEAAGIETDLRIELPRGAYIPAFRSRNFAPSPETRPCPRRPAAGSGARDARSDIWPAIAGSPIITIGVGASLVRPPYRHRPRLQLHPGHE